MAYQPINTPIPKYYNGEKVFGKKRDCEDFKAYFWNRRYCKLSNNCEKCGYYYEVDEYYEQLESFYPEELLYTGIKLDRWREIIS